VRTFPLLGVLFCFISFFILLYFTFTLGIFSNVPPTKGNACRGNVKNGRILEAMGHLKHPWRPSWRGILIFFVFWEHFRSHRESLWQPWAFRGDPTLAIFRPRGRHFSAPGRRPGHHAKKTCIFVAERYEKVRFLEDA